MGNQEASAERILHELRVLKEDQDEFVRFVTEDMDNLIHKIDKILDEKYQSQIEFLQDKAFQLEREVYDLEQKVR